MSRVCTCGAITYVSLPLGFRKRFGRPPPLETLPRRRCSLVSSLLSTTFGSVFRRHRHTPVSRLQQSRRWSLDMERNAKATATAASTSGEVSENSVEDRLGSCNLANWSQLKMGNPGTPLPTQLPDRADVPSSADHHDVDSHYHTLDLLGSVSSHSIASEVARVVGIGDN